MRKLVNNLKRNLVYFAVTASTLDQWRMQKIDFEKKKAAEIRGNEITNTKINNLESNVVKLESQNSELLTKNKELESKTIFLPLAPAWDQGEGEKKTEEIESQNLNLVKRLKELEKKAQETIPSEDQKIEMVNEYEQILSERQEAKKEIDNIVDDMNSELISSIKPSESNVFSFLNQIKDYYVEFLNELTLEELAILTNLLGLFFILFSLISITTIMFGEYLVNYFKLDSKIPRLSKYILLRSQINKIALVYYFIYLYIVIVIFILINIYMFIL